MAKLYIFGIGGTGSRVIRSLTMLLASGLKLKYDIVPILIDPDNNGGDLNRTTQLLRNYQNIRKEISNDHYSDFFKTKIESLDDSHINNFEFELNGISNDRFEDFIDYALLDNENQSLIDLLFSKHNLSSNLEVGFKGNPNIGSIVLNQFTRSKAYQTFANNFTDHDRIFIISSIFGGTGAAGFPLLLKNIRDGQIKDKKFALLRNAKIGAITVLPYFKVEQDEDSAIDSHNFISKTKAALKYYSTNVTGNNSINSLYYIGDTDNTVYNNCEGGNLQKNNAHFIEIASALAIFDFANETDQNLKTIDGKAVDPMYKEYGIKTLEADHKNAISFLDFYEKTDKLLKVNLTRYFYFDLMMNNKLEESLKNPFAISYRPKIDMNFMNQPFYSKLKEFNKSFRIWLGELNRNNISFSPFKIVPKANKDKDITDYTTNLENIFSLVNHVHEKKTNFSPLRKKNFNIYIECLNKAAKHTHKTPNTSSRFMELFSEATKSLVSQKIF